MIISSTCGVHIVISNFSKPVIKNVLEGKKKSNQKANITMIEKAT